MNRQPLVRRYVCSFRLCSTDPQRADDEALRLAEAVAVVLGARWFRVDVQDEPTAKHPSPFAAGSR